MKTHRVLTFALLLAAVNLHTPESHAGTLGETDPFPGGISYRRTVQLGLNDAVSFTRHVGAWSWQDESQFEVGEDPVGWTHTSDWIALTLDEPTTLTLRMERAEGIQVNPTTIAGTASMFPSFTLWSNWDNDDGDVHVYNNDGPVEWAEDLVYIDHLNNSSQFSAERSWFLPAGTYTFALGSNAPSTESETLRQGYQATFTTVPEPATATTLLAGIAMLAGRRLRRRTAAAH